MYKIANWLWILRDSALISLNLSSPRIVAVIGIL